MKGNETVLKHLQRALTMELTTVNTYQLQERKLDDWGIDRLASRMREEIEEERGHANRYLTRLIFLEGVPDVQTLDEIGQDNNVREIFDRQMKMETSARDYYRQAANDCGEVNDYVSRELFVSILADEEGHIDFLEEQFDRIEMMGEQMYIGRHISTLGEHEE